MAEHEGENLRPVSFELLTRGRRLASELGRPLCAVVIGRTLPEDRLRELIRRGADQVYAVGDPRLERFIVENHSAVLVELIRRYRPGIILAGATSRGRSLMPHAAVRIHTGLTADCTELAIEGGTENLLQIRPAIGGNVLATIKTPDHRPQMATIRPRSTRPSPRDAGRDGKLYRIRYTSRMHDGRAAWVGLRQEGDGEGDLQEAEIIVAGGRGLGKAGNFSLLHELAARLGGAVGASREAVDRGWISYPHQVGLSGRTVSPRLYIAVGISGAVQHLAGIKTAETIVAINSDPEAPIFRIADLGLVGDLFGILPRLIERLPEEGDAGEVQPDHAGDTG